jgi:hypothetical protein
MNTQNVFTPQWVLDRVSAGLAPDPAPIPKDCGFDWLLENRERIRMLQLMPIKDDYVRKVYNAMDKDELARPILEEFQKGIKVLMRPNDFPYALGRDVSQWLAWVPDDVGTEFVWDGIRAVVGDLDSIVSFERNRSADGKLMKGTFPAIRHIHVWERKI